MTHKIQKELSSVPKGTHQMQIPHPKLGHATVTWEPEVSTPEAQAAVEEARRIFGEVRAQGGLIPCAVDPFTKEPTVLNEFDPNAACITFIPFGQAG